VAAAQSLAMAALTLAHVINLPEIIALAPLQGLINAFDVPARQSFLVQMVEDRNDLSNAIAINSSMVNGARLVGPSIAGLVIAVFGESWCFLVHVTSAARAALTLDGPKRRSRMIGPRLFRNWASGRATTLEGGEEKVFRVCAPALD
jgi:MFS family permease